MFKEYFLSAASVLVFVSFVSVISHTKAKKITRSALGIIVICVIMLPFIDILGDNALFDFDFSYISDENIELNDEEIEAAFETGIERFVAEKYSKDPADIHVSVDEFDISTMRAQRIYVTLRGGARDIDYRRLEDIIRDNFTNEGRCEVELDVG